MDGNLCGPSGALKDFGAHAERDRSLYRNRRADPSAGPANVVSPSRRP